MPTVRAHHARQIAKRRPAPCPPRSPRQRRKNMSKIFRALPSSGSSGLRRQTEKNSSLSDHPRAASCKRPWAGESRARRSPHIDQRLLDQRRVHVRASGNSAGTSVLTCNGASTARRRLSELPTMSVGATQSRASFSAPCPGGSCRAGSGCNGRDVRPHRGCLRAARGDPPADRFTECQQAVDAAAHGRSAACAIVGHRASKALRNCSVSPCRRAASRSSASRARARAWAKGWLSAVSKRRR